jgi:ABC-type cobalamin/Fe3+-siderophores transport system ATPase subunit
VTHHPEEILPAFNMLLVIKGGRVIARGATETTLSSAMFNELYGVSLNLVRKNGRYWPIPE